MQKDTAYELQVEIIKDFSDVRKDIQDVFNVIDRGENYLETVQKVRILFQINFYIYLIFPYIAVHRVWKQFAEGIFDL